MKRLLTILWLTASLANAQTGTSPNLVNTANQQGSGWVGTVPYTGTGGGYSGGSTPGYNAATNTIHFGYNQGTAAYTYAFSQALQNSGLAFTGYNYSWDYLNQNPYNGTLSANVNFAGVNGTALHTKTWTLGTTTDWTTVSGTETFNAALGAASIANFSLSFAGKDARWWAGYYGPQVRNPSLSLNFGADLCSSNPLSSPSCAGYQQAYTDQQCASNPLYSTQCAGYAAAYQTQQCSANPLYSPSCAGYATAYVSQQCSNNPLYSTTCPGYDTAYFNQQCGISPLYSQSCSGYSVAYHDQQCRANPLYATDCVGYDQAYLNAQCIRDSLYSKQCTGYATAYAIKYLIPLENSAGVNQSLSTTAAAQAAPPVTIVPSAVETATSTPSSTSATSQTSVTSVVAPPPSAASPTSPMAQSAPPPAPAPQEQKPSGNAAPTARQALAERRQEAAKNEAVAKGKDLAKSMGNAKSMDEQMANQNLVAAAMGYNPNFSAYQSSMIPDATSFYQPKSIYGGQKNIETRNGVRMFGGSEQKHQDMVNSQFNLGN